MRKPASVNVSSMRARADPGLGDIGADPLPGQRSSWSTAWAAVPRTTTDRPASSNCSSSRPRHSARVAGVSRRPARDVTAAVTRGAVEPGRADAVGEVVMTVTVAHPGDHGPRLSTAGGLRPQIGVAATRSGRRGRRRGIRSSTGPIERRTRPHLWKSLWTVTDRLWIVQEKRVQDLKINLRVVGVAGASRQPNSGLGRLPGGVGRGEGARCRGTQVNARL